MRAVIYNEYGSPQVLHYADVEKPIPRKGEVLVRVAAASVNSADSRMLQGIVPRLMGFGLSHPRNKILGADLAGVVENVGGTSSFMPGDRVFGDISDGGFGSLAEFVCVPDKYLSVKPDNLTMEEAAAVPMAAVTALQGLRDKGEIKTGEKVLINGASGGVGNFAVQLAKSYDCEVTAVCSGRQKENARKAGADHFINYEEEDFTRSGRTYDLILGCNGYHSLGDYSRSLTPRGRYVMVGGTGKQIAQALMFGSFHSRKDGKRFTALSARAGGEDLGQIKSLIEEGKIKPQIDRRYTLKETPQAFSYFGEGHARGKVVISVACTTRG